MNKKLIIGFIIFSFISFCNIARSSEKGLVYYLPFENSLNATVCTNEYNSPAQARGIKFVDGINGKGIYVGGWGERNYKKAPLLEYNGEKLFGKEGTISFWVSPSWDGYIKEPLPWYYFFVAMGGKEDSDFTGKYIQPKENKYTRISIWMYYWLQCGINGTKKNIKWKCRNAWMRGDWWFITLTWNKDKAKLYVNGVPQEGAGDIKLTDIQKFYIGSLPFIWTRRYRANCVFDEFKIYNRALLDEEIRKNFRKFAPVDFIFERRYLRANENEKVKIELLNKSGKKYISKNIVLKLFFDNGELIKEVKKRVRIRDRKIIEIPAKLNEGNYRLEVQLGSFKRSFPLIVYNQKSAPPETDKDIKIGEKIVDIDCTKENNGFISSCKTEVKEVKGIGRYREGGSGKWDRFGYEVKIPEGSCPVLLEITWPDDKERSMGFYMIAKRKREWLRDRLGGGVQCGGEYPSTDKMVKSRYLFYPETDEYLFEARTLITGMPAAVSSIKIYKIEGRLPKLKINQKGKGQFRNFGHLDEDQSFELLISQPEENFKFGKPISLLETFLDYMDYTGQNVISYPVLRYWWSYLDQPPVNKIGSGLRTTGWINLMLDMFEKRDKKFIMGIHLFTVPSPPEYDKSIEERIKEGYFYTNKNGEPVYNRRNPGFGTNIFNPEVRKQFIKLISEIVERFGSHPAFDGIDLWNSEKNSIFFPNIEVGYGDYTVGLFEKETGIKVPGEKGQPDRFYRRYTFLTGEKKKEWLEWRTKKTYEFVKELSEILKRKGKKLYLSLRGYWAPIEILYNETSENVDFKKGLYENYSIDIEKLKRLKNVVVAPMRFSTSYRWLKHWHGNVENLFNEINWNIKKFEVFSKGKNSSTAIYPVYFESFLKSLKPEKYKTYFQNADPKPWRKYFLQDLSVAVASQDTSQILVGAQPPGTWGREKEAREWARAFNALPSGNFKDIKGLSDPVCGRYFPAKEGTYFYLVNLIWEPLKAHIDNLSVREVIDLSTGEELKVENRKVEIELNPFQIRAFLIKGIKLNKMEGEAKIGKEVKDWYIDRLNGLKDFVCILKSGGANVEKYEIRVKKIENAINKGYLEEAHRLIFSKMMRKLHGLVELSKKGYLKKMSEMMSKSQYAVNCGSMEFYMSKSGTLFFPDRKYEEGEYGYYENYLTVIRPVSGLPDTVDKKIYETEAYNFSGYKFTVKPGKYTVKLYLKVGYQRGAKPGYFVFNVDIEGKRVLDKFDLFKACGENFWNVVVKEFKGIEVKDGVLDIHYSVPSGVSPTARLCNAIEVIPEKGEKEK